MGVHVKEDHWKRGLAGVGVADTVRRLSSRLLPVADTGVVMVT